MSRILIHSNAPWVPTGYGKQTRILAHGLQRLGHEVAVSAFAGLTGADVVWEDIPVMPHGQVPFGLDMLLPHINRFKPDLTITLMDFYMLEPLAGALQNHNVAAWLPIDCTPMSQRDLSVLLASRVHPIAMSEFGHAQIIAARDKFGPTIREPFYAPHMVDMDTYVPMSDRWDWRGELELGDSFVVGMCAANKDTVRKAFPEQFQAFSMLHNKYPEAVLLVHSSAVSRSGLDLHRLADSMGIGDAVRFSDQYKQDAGLFDDQAMCRWYNALDVLMLCSYGEGFGVPVIEAQACGTPVVASNNSALTELVDSRNLVQTDRFWNFVHEAWWGRPRPDMIFRRLNRIRANTLEQRDQSRAHTRMGVEFYDHNSVMNTRWKSIVEELCG